MKSYGYDQQQTPRQDGPHYKKRDSRRRLQIAYRTWNRNNLLSVSTGVEEREGFWTESVFLRAHEGYDQTRYIAMQLDALDLRALSHACRETIFSQKSAYRKFTDPSKGGGQGEIKSLSVAKDAKNAYINLQQGERNISIVFQQQELLAFADQIEQMALMTEKLLYNMQTTAR